MESNPPDHALAPSSAGVLLSQAEVTIINLPSSQEELRYAVNRFAYNLFRASREAAAQNLRVDFRVSMIAQISQESFQNVRQQPDIPMYPNNDHAAGHNDQVEFADPITDAAALTPTPNDQNISAQDASPVDPAVTQTDPEDDADDNRQYEEAESGTIQCKICMDELTRETIITVDCGCAYCVTCLNSHFMHAFTHRAFYPARCCSSDGINMDNVAPYLTEDVLMHWSLAESEFSERIPMYCANRECSAHIPANRLEGRKHFVECHACFTDTCKECRQWREVHIGDDSDICPEDIVSKEDRELANSEKWKQCPGCKNLVERSEGCNNMTCECGTEFCYDCGVEFRSDHRCGCHTIPDPDGYHYRPGEVPDDVVDEVNPRDALSENEWIERLANALHFADIEGHGRFENAIDAGNWLWDEREDLVLDCLDDSDQTLAFQAYDRVRDEHAARANDLLRDWGDTQEEDWREDDDECWSW